MKILHGNALSSPDMVDGVNAAIWSAAREQAAMGHDVGVLLGEPSDAVRALAARCGLRLHVMGPSLREYGQGVRRALTECPDVVHLHSTFAPRLAIAAERSRRAGVPVVTTPHGGLRPYLLGYAGRRQRAYARTVERRRLRRSDAITALLPSEVRGIRTFAPRFDGPLCLVPSPVDGVFAARENPPGDGPVVFLGRLVRHVKGLDRFHAIARRMPGSTFDIYGDGPDRQLLLDERPANVTIHPPVYGEEKAAVLARAGIYLQLSRYEAFGISVGEAMLAGVPCAISETMDLAPIVAEHRLGLVLGVDPDAAAAALSAALADPARLRDLSAAARTHARRHFTPRAVASGYLDAYRLAQTGTSTDLDAAPRPPRR